MYIISYNSYVYYIVYMYGISRTEQKMNLPRAILDLVSSV